MDAKNTIQNYWDYRSKTYSNGLIESDEEDRNSWKKWLGEFAGERRLKILDVGTGPGFLALLFAEMGHEVTAVDLSSQMIEKARENAKNRGLKIRLLQGDAENLKFPDGTFDLISSKYLLWTLPAPQKAIEEWKRVVKRGGTVLAIDGEWHRDGLLHKIRENLSSLISLFQRDGYMLRYKRQYKPIISQLPMYRSNQEMARDLFIKAGLSGVSVKSMDPLYEAERKKMGIRGRIASQGRVYIISGGKKE